jgi:hypothetical protein
MVRFFDAASCWLSSLGIALLVLSVVLVPTNRLLADTGGSARPLDPGCLANNGCNGGGCVEVGVACPFPNQDKVNCRWTMAGCNGCTCTGCFTRFNVICNCQCQTGTGTCASGTQCNPNQG